MVSKPYKRLVHRAADDIIVKYYVNGRRRHRYIYILIKLQISGDKNMTTKIVFSFFFWIHVPYTVSYSISTYGCPIVTVAKRYYSDTLNLNTLIEACTVSVAIKLKPRLYRFLVFIYFGIAAASSTNTNLTSLDICFTGELIRWRPYIIKFFSLRVYLFFIFWNTNPYLLVYQDWSYYQDE